MCLIERAPELEMYITLILTTKKSLARSTQRALNLETYTAPMLIYKKPQSFFDEGTNLGHVKNN